MATVVTHAVQPTPPASVKTKMLLANQAHQPYLNLVELLTQFG